LASIKGGVSPCLAVRTAVPAVSGSSAEDALVDALLEEARRPRDEEGSFSDMDYFS
jgi:hypothetical protein